jgi:hypothetical protein
MALSNVFREPRRELTESLIGSAVVGGLLWLDYYVSRQVMLADPHAPPLIICMFIFGLVGLAGVALTFIVLVVLPHWVGEEICDFLSRRGLELRPKDRYR